MELSMFFIISFQSYSFFFSWLSKILMQSVLQPEAVQDLQIGKCLLCLFVYMLSAI